MVQDDVRPVGYRHVGHVRTADEDVAEVVATFVQQVAADGDRLLIACPEPVAGVLARAFGDDDGVQVLQPLPFDGRPAAGVAELMRVVDRGLPEVGHRLQLVTAVQDPPSGSSGRMQFEALLNHVLADRPVDHLCLMEPAAVVDGPGSTEVLTATHPCLLTDGELIENPGYRDPADVVTELQRSRVPDPIEATEPALSLLDLDDMRSLRRAVSRVLADSPLSADAAQDFVLAIDEIVANAAEHGVPPVDVRLWCGRDRLLCAITDHGACFEDPLAGYGPAHGDMAVGGMGCGWPGGLSTTWSPPPRGRPAKAAPSACSSRPEKGPRPPHPSRARGEPLDGAGGPRRAREAWGAERSLISPAASMSRACSRHHGDQASDSDSCRSRNAAQSSSSHSATSVGSGTGEPVNRPT